MKRNILTFTAGLLIALFFFALNSCNKEDNKQDKPDDDEVSISENTEVIQQTDWDNTIQQVDTTDYTFTFSDKIQNTNEIKEGDIIVSTDGEGYLRRVAKVEEEGGEVTVKTEFVSLDQVIENGGFSIEEQLTQNKIEKVVYYKKGVKVDTSFAKSPEEQDIYSDIDIYLGPGENIHLTGNFQMNPTLTMEYNINWFELDYLEFGAGVEEQLQLAADLNLENVDDKHETQLANIYFTPILVQVGPVPVVITPVVVIKAGVEYNLETNIWTSLNQQLNYETGVVYNGEWNPYSNLQKSFSFNPPQLNATATAKAYLKPEFHLKIYGTISPKLFGELYDSLRADYSQASNWELHAGATFGAGINVSILSNELYDEEWDFDNISYTNLVADNNSVENQPPQLPFCIAPQDDTVNVSINPLMFSWTCEDPDDDPITYDFYMAENEMPSSFPLYSVEDTTATTLFYNQLYVDYNTKYYWQVVATDSEGNTTEGPVWEFTTKDISNNNPPNTPQLISPENGSTDVSNTPTLEWTCTDPENDPLIYDIYMGQSESDLSIVHNNYDQTSFTTSQLDANTNYYWKITAADDHGNTSESDVYSFTTESGGGTVDLEWVNVAGGTFQMGSNDGGNDEQPIHTVTLNSFEISKYEITNAQYAEFLNDINCNSDGSYNDDEYGNVEYIDMDDSYCQIDYSGGQFVVESGKDNHPVIEVPWYGANAFAQWAGGRLPTEAEWEFAARGGNQSQGYEYSGSDNLDEVGWHNVNSSGQTHEVGQKQANELGIYDMSGNVLEWCHDWYDGDYYSNSPENNPQGPSSRTYRVYRGGSWNFSDYYCRVAIRYKNNPDGTSGDQGFRIVQ